MNDTRKVVLEWQARAVKHPGLCPLEVQLRQNRTLAFQRSLRVAGTLANGGVFVAASSLSGDPMLGLFAGRNYAAGELVTFYGGGTTDCSVATHYPRCLKTHMARVHSSDLVLDGLLWSQQFDSGAPVYRYDPETKSAIQVVPADAAKQAELKQQAQLSAASRPRWKPTGMPELVGDERDLKCLVAHVLECGVGYMGNTRGPRGNNAKFKRVEADKFGNSVPAIVATRDIAANEEITYAYKNKDLCY